MTEPAVRMIDVSKSYDGRPAVTRMSWSAPAGAITCILGPNGAGKTTAMEIAEGLRRADSGQVDVLGVDPWTGGPHHRGKVGVMLQEGGLPGSVKPLRFLRHAAALYGAQEHLPGLVEALQIDRFRPVTLRRLSGGQRQRVALAAALLPHPRLAFLDEPSAGLDPHARLDVWDLLRRFRDEGTTLVVTTHSFEEAAMADQLVVISDGSTAATGTPGEVGGTDLQRAYFDLTRTARR